MVDSHMNSLSHDSHIICLFLFVPVNLCLLCISVVFKLLQLLFSQPSLPRRAVVVSALVNSVVLDNSKPVENSQQSVQNRMQVISFITHTHPHSSHSFVAHVIYSLRFDSSPLLQPFGGSVSGSQ